MERVTVDMGEVRIFESIALEAAGERFRVVPADMGNPPRPSILVKRIGDSPSLPSCPTRLCRKTDQKTGDGQSLPRRDSQ